MNRKFLVSVTSLENPNWKKQIEDIKKFKINEFALFLTALDSDGRKECYQLLEQLGNISIPFCHARTDMTESEFEYLSLKFGTNKFNIHPISEFPLEYQWKEIKKKIYVENVIKTLPTEEELKDFAGICLDTAHLEDDRLTRPEKYERAIKLLDKYPIGANHINGILDTPAYVDSRDPNRACYDNHDIHSLSEFDYLKKLPARYFSDTIAIEVKNDIETQLKIKEILEEIIGL